MTTRPLWTLTDTAITNGLGLPGNHDNPDWPRYIRTTDIADEKTLRLDTFASQPPDIAAKAPALNGDILMTAAGTIGKSIRLTGISDACYAGFLVLFRPRSELEGRFLSYWMQSQHYWDQIVVGAVRSTIDNFSAGKYRLLQVPIVDDGRQRLIVDFLDEQTAEIDSMDADLDRLVDTLQERRTSLVTQVVFGFQKQQEQTWDEHSPLRGIPPSWGTTKFGYEFKESQERNGTNPPGPLLSISEYRGVERNTRSEGQQASVDVSNYRVVRPDQLAVNMMWMNHGGLGVSELTGYISPDYKSFWISSRYEPRYVHYLLRDRRYIQYFASIGSGVRPNAQRVTKTALDMVPLPLPPLSEQRRIADHLDRETAEIDSMIEDARRLKEVLSERRRVLISDVVTGRKEVPA